MSEAFIGIFEAAWDRIKHAFSEAQTEAIAFIDRLATGIAAMSPQALKIILQAVDSAEALGGTGGEKFAHAEATALTELEALGESVIPNILHGAIEAAVANLPAPVADGGIA